MPARLFISAAHKSSGKTTVSVGIAAALAARGLTVQTFKKGPDYIDPLWLGKAAGRPCFNLDFHTQTNLEIASQFERRATGADVALVEGNKGLYDGVDVDGSDSSAALATLLDVPVTLVVDASGITRGIAPLVQGYRTFDPDVTIAGVVLNKVAGDRQEAKLRAALELYTDVPVVGAIRRSADMDIPERHLGLIPANEMDQAGCVTRRLSRCVADQVDLDHILRLTESRSARVALDASRVGDAAAGDLRIGIARDDAFGFYYPDDLEAFAAAGATLVPIDTLRDSALPPIDGLFLGGGFPETQMAELEANVRLRGQIKTAIGNGLPTYAECGGMMYLARSLTWQGERRDMVGAIPADAVMHASPRGRGYTVLEETGAGPWGLAKGPAQMPAHEFHYSSLDNLPANATFAYRVVRGTGLNGINDGLVLGNLLASYSHLRSVAGNRWVDRFVAFVRECKGQALPSPPVPAGKFQQI